MTTTPSLIDTHCHLRLIDGPEAVPAIVRRARDAGVTIMINVGFDDPTNRAVLDEAATHPGVFCTQGVHPHEAAKATAETFAWIATHADDPRVVALGEMGLDYYKEYSAIPRQHEVFERQLEIAKATGLPVVIHSRDAAEDTFAMLQQAALPQGGIMHCYAYDADWAKRFLDLNFDISFSGVLTFKKAEALHAAATTLPLDRLHVETDAPWLAPMPHRGHTNEPAYVAHTAAALAHYRQLPLAEVAAQLALNAQRRFPRLTLPGGAS